MHLELLVVTVPACADAPYQAIQVGSRWYASTDYEHHQTSLTRAQAHVDADGLLRHVVSERDPGLANWLEATDDRLVCHESVAEEDEDRWVVQRPVADVKKAWSVMARRFGVPVGFGPKLMRHSMATLIAQRGVS